MLKIIAFVLLCFGISVPAFAFDYPGNAIQWRPADPDVQYSPLWAYDANGDIVCPSDDGVSCISSIEMARAREADDTLSCGSEHRALFGYSGYDKEGHWCRELALRHGNRDGFKWRAPVNDVPFHWRRNPKTGNIECASDGANCLWSDGFLGSAFKRKTFVACQPEQYGQSGHWCSRLASERRNNGYEWKQNIQFNPANQATQVSYFSYNESGDIQCPSNNGRNCFWPKTLAEAEAAKQPLVCGADHRAKYGITGYDQVGHWCRALALTHGNAKGFWYQGETYGLTDGGTGVMCASTNGVDCVKSQPLSATFKNGSPLVCGRDHLYKHGIDGYDTPGHWCSVQAASDVLGVRIRVQNPSDKPGRVCQPIVVPVGYSGDKRVNLRCTDLQEGNAVAVNIVVENPLPSTSNIRTVCVESAENVFLGLVRPWGDRSISIDGPNEITFAAGLMNVTPNKPGVTNCQAAYASFSLYN